jgi:hypothetical protein
MNDSNWFSAIMDSVWRSVWLDTHNSISCPVYETVWESVRDSVGKPVRSFVSRSILDSAKDYFHTNSDIIKQ